MIRKSVTPKSRIFYCSPNPTILKFSKPTADNFIKDEELVAMFMGLIKLIRDEERKKVINSIRQKLK